MQKIDVFDIFAGGFLHSSRYYLLQGLFFIVLGLLVWFYPKILAAVLTVIMLAIGFSFCALAFSLWRFNKKYQKFRKQIFELF